LATVVVVSDTIASSRKGCWIGCHACGTVPLACREDLAPTSLALRVRPVTRDRTALATPASLSSTRSCSTWCVRANGQEKTRPGRWEGVRATGEAEGE
jgi:hypothetical protein